MIKNNLSLLLAERNLKITRVSKDTGISRPTLTSLVQNNSKMIHFETINILCQYLRVTPEIFFEYLPFDILFSTYIKEILLKPIGQDGQIFLSKFDFDLYIDIKGEITKTYSLTGALEEPIPIMALKEIPISLDITFDKEQDKDDFATHIYQKLSRGFQYEFDYGLSKAIVKSIMDYVNENYGEDENRSAIELRNHVAHSHIEIEHNLYFPPF